MPQRGLESKTWVPVATREENPLATVKATTKRTANVIGIARRFQLLEIRRRHAHESWIREMRPEAGLNEFRRVA